MSGSEPFYPSSRCLLRPIVDIGENDTELRTPNVKRQNDEMTRTLLWPVMAALLGCVGPAANNSKQQQFSGWMMFRGELMLFPTWRDYATGADPNRRTTCSRDGSCVTHMNCISGVFAGETPPNMRAHDGERVKVTGQLVSYRNLPEVDPPLPRKVLAHKVVSNFCFGDKVMLITSVAFG